MQQCLNDHISERYNNIRRNPLYLLILLVIFAIPIIFITMAYQCNTSFTCSFQTVNAFIIIGLIFAVSITGFIILPLIIAFCLNGCFGMPVSESQPPPPLSRPPRHAFVSYRESRSASAHV